MRKRHHHPATEDIMSYCRFSSDDYRSDVYAYETHGGWQ